MKKKSVTTWTLKLNLKREQFCLVMNAKCNDNIGRQHYFLFLSKDYLLEDDQGLTWGYVDGRFSSTKSAYYTLVWALNYD
jgi:hypothetical protein